uniref:protein tilB homolog isoform X2 n=1 Tax=Osmia lignaria TaxID=473952 RepID=UPI001478E4E7|nr:protein tilB homolog isoform X2 [Osmia lignaria]
MTRITLELIRKRSEHNEGEISTLEEIALHQENIEKIELIDKTCRHLKILLLQNNLVSRIENLSRLKELEYLNLALNNIEAIENLEGLESLKKLDLTVNFIGDLRGIKRLREYAIAALSQLKELDGVPIERSERIKALQVYARLEGEIAESYARYEKARRAEILGYHERIASLPELKEKEEEEDDDDERFWKRASRHTPEERVAIAERLSRKEELKNRERNREEPRISNEAKLFSPDGKPYNTNQPKVSFKLNDEQYEDRVVLEVAVYKYLDTCHLDVDVQPDYVRVTIKGKVLQLTLPCEVSVDDSTAKRNTTNGTLVVTMPRLKPVPIIGNIRKKNEEHSRTLEPRRPTTTTMREYLEIGPASDDLDFSRIFIKSKKPIVDRRREEEHEEKLFEDSSEVPPLE